VLETLNVHFLTCKHSKYKDRTSQTHIHHMWTFQCNKCSYLHVMIRLLHWRCMGTPKPLFVTDVPFIFRTLPIRLGSSLSGPQETDLNQVYLPIDDLIWFLQVKHLVSTNSNGSCIALCWQNVSCMSKTLKFGFARIPKTYRRLTTDNILAAKAIFWVKAPNRWKPIIPCTLSV
jgi:hypothetical protein